MPHTQTFHAGELAAQKRAGAGDVASRVAPFIRDHMPQQHRDFHTSLPFVVLSAEDENSRPWITILEGREGFVGSPDARTLTFDVKPDPADPLAKAMAAGTDAGMLGIEVATRRRNRLSGFIKAGESGLSLSVRQTFGNCPQYIHEREWQRVENNVPGEASVANTLSSDQIRRVARADTLFIGSGHHEKADVPSNGYDASHRGGDPGFVHVVDATHLRIPDYAGNNFFNTIGNLIENPRVALLFIDFETGGMLHISGRATIDWEPVNSHDPNARRMIDVTVEAVIERPSALSLRWQSDTAAKRSFMVADKVRESVEITSFYLAPTDHLPRDHFEAGQHLPVELEIEGQQAGIGRTYSLSGPPSGQFYRISVKREPNGLASRHLHDAVEVGDLISVGRPAGDFVIPCAECPLVLVSAGVGITPMLSMLHAVAASPSDRPVWFVHGARDSNHHAFRSEVDAIIASKPNFRRVVHYSKPIAADRLGMEFDAHGRISAEALAALQAGSEAHYVICGPSGFLSQITSGLEKRGISSDRIHSEAFGPSA